MDQELSEGHQEPQRLLLSSPTHHSANKNNLLAQWDAPQGRVCVEPKTIPLVNTLWLWALS